MKRDARSRHETAKLIGQAARWWKVRINGYPLLIAGLLFPSRVKIYFHSSFRRPFLQVGFEYTVE